MFDHLESFGNLEYEEIEGLEEVLDDMTNTVYAEEWNKELRSIGVSI
jgi:hypothetical protein